MGPTLAHRLGLDLRAGVRSRSFSLALACSEVAVRRSSRSCSRSISRASGRSSRESQTTAASVSPSPRRSPRQAPACASAPGRPRSAFFRRSSDAARWRRRSPSPTPPALGIFQTLLRRGKMEASLALSDGRKLEFERIVPLDAEYDVLDQAPAEVRENKRYKRSEEH